MIIRRWSEIATEELSPTVNRQAFHSERMTVARFQLKKGCHVARHSHENEQVTILDSGRLHFIYEGGELILSAGEILQIPSHLPHEVHALEDSSAMDLFAPVRQDWITGDAAYLKK